VLRVLKPGGRYFFSVWDSHRYNIYGRIVHETVERFFPQDTPQFFTVPFSCHAIDPVKASVLEAGFTDLDISVVQREKQIPDNTAFARGTIQGNPLGDQIRQRGGDPERVVEAVAEGFQRAFGNPGRMPLQAIFYSARKPA